MLDKDSTLVADAIKAMRDNKLKWLKMNPQNYAVMAEVAGIDSLAFYLMDRLKDDHPEFDKHTFMIQCGYMEF